MTATSAIAMISEHESINGGPEQSGPAALLEMIGANWTTKVIAVAAELRIADHLAGGPLKIEALAAATECHASSLQRLLRALASLDLCTEQDDGAYALTPFGALLRADAEQAVNSWAIWWGKYHWPTWSNLLHSVKTGESAREAATGQQGYAHVANDEHAAAVFNRAMVEVSRLISGKVVRAIDFPKHSHVIDVGGGHGMLLSAILNAHPNARGTLFDLPHALEGAATLMRETGVASRAVVASGDFFESVPAGGDVYLLKSILHNWDDAKCALILRSCRFAMQAHAKLVLVERVMPARMRANKLNQAVARADLNMLVGLGGRERTADEFIALLAAEGFTLTRIVPADLEFSVIEARLT